MLRWVQKAVYPTLATNKPTVCYDGKVKVYITSRFKGTENKNEISELCSAVAAAGMTDFSFVRDIENFQKTFDDPKELWQRALLEIKKCDALLIDVSDSPSGGRVVEAGIAYALGLPIITICKNGTQHKEFYKGISNIVVSYDSYKDIIPVLKRWMESQK